MRFNLRVMSVVMIGLSATVTSARAEKRVGKSELPAAVQKTADEQVQGATVRGYSTDTEDGKLEYEVQMTSRGHSKDVTIAPDGRLLEIEEQVTMESLPIHVRTALQSKAGKGRIAKIESLTKHGSVVAYEAQLNVAGKHSEIQVGPDGEHLDHEE